MLNTDLKIWMKILADHLQTAMPCLIDHQQCGAVKGRTILDSLHSVHTIIEKINGNTAVTNLDQSQAFNRVDHGFVEAVLSMAGFGFHFCSWIFLLYAFCKVIAEVNRVRSKPFTLS